MFPILLIIPPSSISKGEGEGQGGGQGARRGRGRGRPNQVEAFIDIIHDGSFLVAFKVALKWLLRGIGASSK